MAITSIDLNDDIINDIKDITGLTTKKEVVDFALVQVKANIDRERIKMQKELILEMVNDPQHEELGEVLGY